ncbi:MAG TPA: hypothetical protein VMT52_14430 [Planctomycetota bacterium]|nr:hypothetical protein [Planctomycetota bacterium]
MKNVSGWSGLDFPGGLLADGVRAPVPLPDLPAGACRRALETILADSSIPGGTRAAALSTWTQLLEGAREFIALAHALLETEGDASRMRETVRRIHIVLGALLREVDAAYVLEQVSEIVASARRSANESPARLPRPGRIRDFITPLEAHLEEAGVPRVLEPESLGRLLVHLDEFYDDCCLVLARLLQVLSLEIEEARAQAPDLLRSLYRDFVRASFTDNLRPLEPRSAEPGAGPGLVALLRDLEQALARLG